MTAAVLDWHAAAGLEAAVPTVDAFEVQLAEWFGADCNCWPADAAGRFGEWLIAFPAGNGRTRFAAPADLPIIRLAVSAGLAASDPSYLNVAVPEAQILAAAFHHEGASLWGAEVEAVVEKAILACERDAAGSPQPSGELLGVPEAASSRSTPPKELAAFAASASWMTRAVVAVNRSTPTEVLASLANDLNASVRRAVAANPSTGPHLLRTLADSTDEKVRAAVAGNPATPHDVLAALARDTQPVVQALFGNPATPAAVLFAADRTARWAQTAVASNWAAPGELLQSLAAVASPFVLEALARNPSTPAATLERLGTDGQAPAPVHRAVAGNPSTPAGYLAKAAQSATGETLVALAGNLSTPTAALAEIGRTTRDRNVRKALAGNPSAPGDTLAALLAVGGVEGVRRRLAKNPNLPDGSLHQIACTSKGLTLLYAIQAILRRRDPKAASR